MYSPGVRLSFVAVAGLLALGGCSSADETASSTSAASGVDTTTTVDERTADEVAIDQLDVMMFDLGVTDLEATANCVIERLESENIELEGAGTSELVALFGCDEASLSQWLPPTNEALPPETWTCTVESFGEWIEDFTVVEAEAFFGAVEQPADFIEFTANRCDVSAEDLASAI